MKHALSLTVSVLALAFVFGTACEDSSSSPAADLPDADPPSTDGGTPPVVSRCPTPTEPAMEHKGGTIETDETWGPGYHDVTFDVSFRNATLTIEPCAIVRVVPSRGISLGYGNDTPGTLVAKGEADRPIVFEAKEAGTKWTGIQVNGSGNADLAYVTIKDGGDVSSSRNGGALHLLGSSAKPLQRLATVDHVTIENPARYGVVLESHAGFTDASKELVVKGSGELAAHVSSIALGTIPAGSYTGNTVDAIRIWGGSDHVDADTTIHDRGVPYLVGGDRAFPELSVQSTAGAAALLTIEAGVTLKFAKQASDDSGLWVEREMRDDPSRGALRVLGTADKPVVFTSAEENPAPGDWVGIALRGLPDPRTKIEHARVEYAGADTGSVGYSCGTPGTAQPLSNEAAILIYGKPTSAFVTNTAIAHSSANGIERAWTGEPIDFLATNTFTGIAHCRQTYPRPADVACPNPAPCD